ncbi:hypothetical protein [Saccharicrinis fermentans]|uniref:DUF1566 domain-containing protein n=1 Tax=Saccharicrinis fermentans DSM 9555 = JCM 21142 TaxID=869213 RepID=W7YAC1_9BACT|nr:hypothetical protein [Saccharicrinis fermentans]GAF05287.1 hypothetical protein JCM21142_94016 [Saccharicrinis fermentans DSM 9555 = JCM 21142]
MKKIYTILVAVIVTISVFAQSPEKMSYQAVVRNASGELVTTQVGMKLSVLKGDDATSASEEYSEILNPTPNSNGLVSIEFGGQTGWDVIDWADGKFFIKTQTDIDNNGTYDVEGISQLLSVPYAMHAKTAESIVGGVSEIDPVFDASIASKITAADTTKWNNADRSETNELQTLSISNDTIYLSNDGFAKLPTQQQETKTYAVGDSAQGGVVFYVNDKGTHGLAIALTDQAYDGSDPETMVYYYDAPRLCSDASRFDEAGKEFTDWRLPTITEAEILGNAFNNQGMIDKLGIPWTSNDYTHLYWFADVLYLDKLVDGNIGAGQSINGTNAYKYSNSSDKNLVRRGFGKLNNSGDAAPYYSEIEYKTNVRCVRSF